MLPNARNFLTASLKRVRRAPFWQAVRKFLAKTLVWAAYFRYDESIGTIHHKAFHTKAIGHQETAVSLAANPWLTGMNVIAFSGFL